MREEGIIHGSHSRIVEPCNSDNPSKCTLEKDGDNWEYWEIDEECTTYWVELPCDQDGCDQNLVTKKHPGMEIDNPADINSEIALERRSWHDLSPATAADSTLRLFSL